MKFVKLIFVALGIILSGCTTTYSLVSPGAVAVDSLTVQIGNGWNRAPSMQTRSARSNAETWTKDGLLLDRLVIIPGVADGESLLVSRSESAALPVFRADMLPNEIEELVESSMLKFFGEGNSVVSSEGLRPYRFGDHVGFMFEVDAIVSDSPRYRGLVGAFIANNELYILYYLAAVPYYFDKHLVEAQRAIQSAVLSQ